MHEAACNDGGTLRITLQGDANAGFFARPAALRLRILEHVVSSFAYA
jgi:hypothetical protein